MQNQIFFYMGSRKYFHSTGLKFQLTIFLFILLQNSLFAQTYRNPYSWYGIGELQEKTFIKNNFMGGLSLGDFEPNSFTPMNPASYSNLITSTFDISIKGKIQHLVQDNDKFTSNIFSFGYLSLGFPVRRDSTWSAAFGLMPVSSTGYKNTTITAIDTYFRNESFENQGGFSQAFIGTSYRFFKKLNAGVNLTYLFGNTEDLHRLEFTGSTTNMNLLESSKKFYGKLNYEAGLQYFAPVDSLKSKFLVIGLVFTPGINVNANEKRILQTYEIYSTTTVYRDSLVVTDKNTGELYIPLKAGIGFNYTFPGKWNAGLDYRFEQWSKFKNINGPQNLKDIHQVSIGGQYLPDRMSLKYYERISYSAGLKYNTSYLNLGTGTIHQLTLSMGAGFPIANKYNKRIINLVNFGISGGKYFNLPEHGIRETFLNIYLGFRFNDVWFLPSKIE